MSRLLPILYNTPMVEALLAGNKTQTRRIVKAGNHTVIRGGTFPGALDGPKYGAELDNHGVLVAPYQVGDILWVRETWAAFRGWCWGPVYVYKAGYDPKQLPPGYITKWHWHPSIHMPKEAARLFHRVTNVRVEHLQDITIQGLQAEGFLPSGFVSQYAAMTSDCFERFQMLWDKTIKPADRDRCGWDANPWVWVYSFDRYDDLEEIADMVHRDRAKERAI